MALTLPGDLRLFTAAEWRSRWRSHVVVGLLAASTAAAAIMSAAGASRAESAFDRLRDATNASDFAVGVDGGDPQGVLDQLRSAPSVTGARAMHLLFVLPAGSDLFPDYTLLPIAPAAPGGQDALDRPLVVAGRAPDPARPDEIALSEQLARDLGVGPGDRIELASMTEQFVDDLYEGRKGFDEPPDGPRIDTLVTGLARSPAEFGVRPNVIHLTPAFVAEFDGEIRRYDFVHVKLRPDVLARAARGELDLGIDRAEVGPSPFLDTESTGDGLGTIARTLGIVGAVATFSGVVALALALLRGARASERERRALSALGWTRPRQRGALVLSSLPAVFGGAAVGGLAGVALSPRATVGLARAIDPEPSAIVLDAGLALLVFSGSLVLLALALGVAARLAVSPRDAARSPKRTRGNPIGRPLTVAIAIRYALFGAPERGGRASRAALAATALGVTAAVAALVVSASIGRLRADGALFGQGPGRSIESGESTEALDRALPILEADGRVSRIEVLHVTFGIAGPGVPELTTVAIDARRGEPAGSLTRGRLPAAADEVAMGPQTLDDLDLEVGGEIELRSDAGAARYRVVGEVLFPEGDFRHDEGAAMTIAGAERLIGDPHDNAQLHMIDFDWGEGVDTAAADNELADRGLPIFTEQDALLPATVTNLAQVEDLPRYLAVFVGLLCLATLLHATWVSVSARARELATLHALGNTRRANAAIVSSHALVLVTIAIAVGLPLGLVAGRQVWTPIAEGAHVVVLAVAPWGWLLGASAAAVGAGIALAVLAAVRALALRPAAALRSE